MKTPRFCAFMRLFFPALTMLPAAIAALALAPAPALHAQTELPQPTVQYLFAGAAGTVSSVTNSGTIAGANLTLDSTATPPLTSVLTAVGTGPGGQGQALDLTTATMATEGPRVRTGNLAFPATAKMTITGWYRADGDIKGGVDIMTHNSGATDGFLLRFAGTRTDITAPTQLTLRVRTATAPTEYVYTSDAGSFPSSPNTIAAGTAKWVFFAIVWDAAAGAKWYAATDNPDLESDPAGTDATAQPMSESNPRLIVGAAGNTAFKAHLADLRIYHSALTAAQVEAVRLQALPPPSGVTPPPAITSFTPAIITVGGAVTITGKNFVRSGATTITGVQVGGISVLPANYTVDSDTQITITAVPAGIPATGNIKITSNNGDTTSTGSYTLPSPPAITAFTPAALTPGAPLTIIGANFVSGGATTITDIQIGDITVGSGNFTVDSDTQITVTAVPSGIPATGAIKILANTGATTSTLAYTLAPDTLPAPDATDIPQPAVHYLFADTTNTGTLGATYNLTLGTTPPATLAPAGSGPGGNGAALDLSGVMGGTGALAAIAATDTALNDSAQITVTGWIKPDGQTVGTTRIMRNGGGNFGWHLMYSGTAGIASSQLILRVSSTNSAGANTQTDLGSDTNAFPASTAPLATAEWKFFAVTWDTATGATWFSGNDNPNTALAPAGSYASAQAMGPTGYQFSVGSSYGSGQGTNAFVGRLADLRVYKTNLTAAQVAAIRLQALPAPSSNAPVITSFTPATIVTGAPLTITGSNFLAGGATTITDVQIGGISVGAGNFTIDSDTQITVTAVPAGIPATGNIQVISNNGNATSPTSYDTPPPPPPPAITHFAPTTFTASATITITGSNFKTGATNDVTSILFGAIPVGADSYTVDSGTQITITTLPAGMPELNYITVITTTGTAKSPRSYLVDKPASDPAKLPAPIIHYLFNDATTASTAANTGTLSLTTTAGDMNLGTAKIAPAGAGPAARGQALDITDAVMGGTGPQLRSASTFGTPSTLNHNEITITGWYRTDGETTNNMIIFRENNTANDGFRLDFSGTNANGASHQLAFKIGATGQGQYDYTSDPDTFPATPDTIASGNSKWKFFAVTWTETAGAKWYSATDENTPLSAAGLNTTPRVMGANPGTQRLMISNQSASYKGMFADMRIYHKALNASQVRAIRDTAIGAPYVPNEDILGITGISPTIITVGGTIAISGYKFIDPLTGLSAITSISIGGVPVAPGDWTTNNDRLVTVTNIPAGIPATGSITIEGTTGTDTSSDTYAVATAPTIPTSLTAPIASSGGDVTLAASANGVPLPAITWEYNDGTGWHSITNLAPAAYTLTPNGAMLTLKAVTGAMNGWQFRFTADNGIGSPATSNAATLSVNIFNAPYGLILDTQGNIFVTDGAAHVVKQINPDNTVISLAGLPGAAGYLPGFTTHAQFNRPSGITIAENGLLYVADTINNGIRQITPEGVTLLYSGFRGYNNKNPIPRWEDGTLSFACYYQPAAITSDAAGNLYIADTGNHAIRKIDAAGIVTTIAGTPTISGTADGPALAAAFNTPKGIAIDAQGNLYIADTNNHTIRILTPDGHVSTLAGAPATSGTADGTGAAARFNTPGGIRIDSDGYLYIADTGNSTIRELDIATLQVTTIAGVATGTGALDGPAATAKFTHPLDLAFDAAGNLYIADTGNGLIRKIDLTDTVSTLTLTEGTPLVPPAPEPNPSGNTAENSGGGAPTPYYLLALAALVAFRRYGVRRLVAAFDGGTCHAAQSKIRSTSPRVVLHPQSKILPPLLCITALLLAHPATTTHAQQSNTGYIQGQVLNVDTGDYMEFVRVRVRAAGAAAATTALEDYTDSEGRYRINNVPAGAITIEASFTGMPARTATVTLAPGQSVTVPTIEMRIDATGPVAPGAKPDELVHLEKFVVQSARDLTASAIAVSAQRQAANVRSVIAVDEMGFTGDGNFAQALKFLPGVELESDDDGYGNSIALSGAPSANVPVTIDGFDAVTSSAITQNEITNQNQRSVNLSQLSITSISRVEINRSPTPDSPGDSLAGSLNLVRKNAFERARPVYKIQLFGAATQDRITFDKQSSPGEGTMRPIQASLNFSAIVPLTKNFGFTIDLVRAVRPSSYSDTRRQVTANWQTTTSADNPDPNAGYFKDTPNNPDHYMLWGYELRDRLSTVTKNSIALSVDYRFGPNDTVSISYSQAYNEKEAGVRRVYWQLGRGRVDPNSTLTHTWNYLNKPVTDNSSQVVSDTAFTNTVIKNFQISAKYRHTGRIWQGETGVSFGRSSDEDIDLGRNRVFTATLQQSAVLIDLQDIQRWSIGNISTTFQGIPINPLNVTSFFNGGYMEQELLGGWPDPKPTILTSLPNLRFRPTWNYDKKTQLYGNLTRYLDIADTFHTIKLGFDAKYSNHEQYFDSVYGSGGNGYVYDGIDAPIADYIDTGYNRELPQNVGVPTSLDLHKLADFYNANRDRFLSISPENNWDSYARNNRYFEEKILAAYLRFDSKFLDHRLILTYGVRVERTEDYAEGPQVDPATGAVHVRAATAQHNYNSWFPSVNASYTILQNLIARIAYSQTIGRPDTYNIIPGFLSLPSLTATDAVIRMTNPDLKPWKSQNLVLSLELYTGNAGDLTLRAYRRWVSNAFADTVLPYAESQQILEESGLLHLYPDASVRRPTQISGTIVTSGLELSGRYNFDKLLPSWARGLTANFSVARNTITGGSELTAAFGAQKMYLFPWTASGGLNFSRKNYSLRLNGKWTSLQRRTYWPVSADGTGRYAPGTYDYWAPVFQLDLNAKVNITRHLSLFLSGRNITGYEKVTKQYGPYTPDLMKYSQLSDFEPLWTLGMEATF